MRRVGFPVEFGFDDPVVFCDPGIDIPDAWMPRGRWSGRCAMHTFCDDYRQEFFWRRPVEGLIVACSAGVVTAPDYSVYDEDPMEWARYQVWRSAMVAAYWQVAGAVVLPVVSFKGSPDRFVRPGSLWAVRGPARGGDLKRYLWDLRMWFVAARPGGLVVFGNPISEGEVDCPVYLRALVSSKGIAAHKEVA